MYVRRSTECMPCVSVPVLVLGNDVSGRCELVRPLLPLITFSPRRGSTFGANSMVVVRGKFKWLVDSTTVSCLGIGLIAE